MELVQDTPMAVLAVQIQEEYGRVRQENIEISEEKRN
jgi:hypothetical protein